MSGEARMVLISALSRLTIGAGVPAGAKKPCHSVEIEVRIVDRLGDGRNVARAAGALGRRHREELHRPAFNSGVAAGKPGKYMSTWPPSRSFSAGPAPL